jgi:heme-degrading monooxygenase HmoA
MIVVLFSTKAAPDRPEAEYRETSARLHEIVEAMPGFISYREYADEDGEYVAIVRFESAEALRAWGTDPVHVAAQRRGREAFYHEYWIQVCETVREGWFRRGERYREDLTELFRQAVGPH